MKAIIKDDLHDENSMIVIAMVDDFMRWEAIIKKGHNSYRLMVVSTVWG